MKRHGVLLSMCALVGLAACSSGSGNAASAPAGKTLVSSSDGVVIKQAFGDALNGVAGIDQACVQNALEAIPADFTFPVATAGPDATASPNASAPDPLSLLSTAECGAAADPDAALKKLSESPAGKELVVRVLASTFEAQGRKVDQACLRRVLGGVAPTLLGQLLSAGASLPDDVSLKLLNCSS